MVKARMRKKVAAANQAATEMDGEDDPGSKEEADAELDATMSSLAGHQKRKVTKRAKFLEKIRVATANKMKKSGKKKTSTFAKCARSSARSSRTKKNSSGIDARIIRR